MLEEYIKNLEFPLVAFYSIIMNKNIDDINKSIFVKIFINNHMDIVVEHNLLYFNLIDYPITYNTIYDTYHIISRQQSIVPYLAKFKKSYNNMFFWKQPIDKQIKYLQNIHLKFLSYFDASKSLLYYHVKLKQITEINGDYLIVQNFEEYGESLDLLELSKNNFDKIIAIVIKNSQGQPIFIHSLSRVEKQKNYKCNEIKMANLLEKLTYNLLHLL